MAGCDNKIKTTCGTKMNATCVDYRGFISVNSELKDESCLVIEDTTKDTYELVDTLFDNINLEDLGDKCLDYNESEAGKIKVKEALIKFEEEICSLKDITTEVGNNSGLNVGELDLKCLQEPCDNPVTDLNILLQLMIDKICEIENNLNV